MLIVLNLQPYIYCNKIMHLFKLLPH